MIKNGKIANYQAVVPSMEHGPRDETDALGPAEASLVGNPDRRSAQPLRSSGTGVTRIWCPPARSMLDDRSVASCPGQGAVMRAPVDAAEPPNADRRRASGAGEAGGLRRRCRASSFSARQHSSSDEGGAAADAGRAGHRCGVEVRDGGTLGMDLLTTAGAASHRRRRGQDCWPPATVTSIAGGKDAGSLPRPHFTYQMSLSDVPAALY